MLEPGLLGTRVQGPGPDRLMGLWTDGKGSRTLWNEGDWGPQSHCILACLQGLTQSGS